MELLRWTALATYGLSAGILVLKMAEMLDRGINPPLWMRVVTTVAALCFAIALIDVLLGLDAGLFLMRLIWNLVGAMILVATMYTVYWKKR